MICKGLQVLKILTTAFLQSSLFKKATKEDHIVTQSNQLETPIRPKTTKTRGKDIPTDELKQHSSKQQPLRSAEFKPFRNFTLVLTTKGFKSNFDCRINSISAVAWSF